MEYWLPLAFRMPTHRDSKVILDRSSLLRMNDLRSSYSKSGWSRFDEKAKPYSADEVRQYRSYLAVTTSPSIRLACVRPPV